ncbi:heterokaryon incompatibility protein-domain-containing protein [Podospora australis]|uniref:Heterokaryon incompatibility protein-domain-containing protein n=1 Tax=Podospora australis TaxID=1536484 RepID=A0AAN6WJ75_9PEZI|nr:heterokaryon incompatibility protein-domain-containing protein [Podospora australis]
MIGKSTDCDWTIQTVHSWLQSCRPDHDMCSHVSAMVNDWHPTRLVDLGPNRNSIYWTLYSTQEDGSLRMPVIYMALSYRWGANKLRLLNSTLAEFRKGTISIHQLPQTFQDFSFLAKRFGVRYLWIDALCIIQDSARDWEIESLRMRQVYANSVCTIAASASTNEQEGLFRVRTNLDGVLPGLIQIPVTPLSSQDQRQMVPFYIFDDEVWESSIYQSPLHRRGWAFQEQYLSPRMLYFTGNQVFWECIQGGRRCEGFPNGISPYAGILRQNGRVWNLKQQLQRLQDNGGFTDMSTRVWCDLVTVYSRCDLTNPEDRLPAFAGLAKFFAEKVGDDYVAGHWKSRLLRDLCWTRDDIEAVTKPQASHMRRIASWSWASIIDVPVYYAYPWDLSEDYPYDYLTNIVQVQVKPQANDDVFGPLSGDFLALHGVPLEKSVTFSEGVVCKDGICGVPMTTSSERSVNSQLPSPLAWCLDNPLEPDSEIALEKQTYLLPLKTSLCCGGGFYIQSLVLTPTVDSCAFPNTRCFTRVGLVTEHMWKGSDLAGFCPRQDGVMIFDESTRARMELITIV